MKHTRGGTQVGSPAAPLRRRLRPVGVYGGRVTGGVGPARVGATGSLRAQHVRKRGRGGNPGSPRVVGTVMRSRWRRGRPGRRPRLPPPRPGPGRGPDVRSDSAAVPFFG